MDGSTAPCPVLIVEDDSSIAQMVTRVVNRAAWPVHSVGNAADALKLIAENEYTAIVLDLMLPNGSGRDIIEVLRRDRPELLRRVIVMTASPSLLKSIRTDEVAGTLTKPFDIHHLTDLLGNASLLQDSSNC